MQQLSYSKKTVDGCHELRHAAQRGFGKRVQELLPPFLAAAAVLHNQVVHSPMRYASPAYAEYIYTCNTLRTALRLAIWNDWLPVVCTLVEACSWLCMSDHMLIGQHNALEEAACSPCGPDVCAALLRSKAQVDQGFASHRSPLQSAIHHDRISTVRYLLAAKARLEHGCRNSKTCKWSALYFAVRSAQLSSAETTMTRGLSTRHFTTWTRNRRKHRTTVVALLLRANANTQAALFDADDPLSSTNSSTNSSTALAPLQIAVANGDNTIVRLLTHAKADVHAIQPVSETMLYRSFLPCDLAMARVLYCGGGHWSSR
jgi:hypothetical protein